MAKKVYKTTKKYPCPFCDRRLLRTELVTHIQNDHEELIPENYTAARVVFDSINKTDHGKCMVCKKPVYEWDEKICRYKNLCDNPKCREQVRKTALERHIKVYNKPTLLNDGAHQEKMLANRKISGKYKYSDGTVFTYTGKYEKNVIEFMDTVLNIDSKDIQMPGPILDYEYDGETHQWITDIYYIPANLIIEVKDGGDNPNKRSMPVYRGKQAAKEVMITNLGKFNYIRLTNNDFSQLLVALANIKYDNMDQSTANNVHYFINESTDIFSEEVGGLPTGKVTPDSSIWIEPYLMNNTFDIAIGSDISDRVIMRGIDGEIKSVSSDEFEEMTDTTGTIYIRRDIDNDFNKIMINNLMKFNFDEAVRLAIRYPVRVLDELALYKEWTILNKNIIHEEEKMIKNGVKRQMETSNNTTGIYDNGKVIKGSVILSSNIKGYFVHTPDDYYLASDYYTSPGDIPDNVIDTMSDLYDQYKRRTKYEYSE